MNKKVIESKIVSLKKSKFRGRFHLKDTDKEYMDKVGMQKIKCHAYDFIRQRLSPKEIANDGKQTPMRGHPVFIAQHATATCCRNCLYKWHHIAKNKELTEEEIDYVVTIIMEWLKQEVATKSFE